MTFFSVAGIGLGVMALIIVISVMNGFEGELKKRILGVIPHVLLEIPSDRVSQNNALTQTDQIDPQLNFQSAEQLNLSVPSKIVKAVTPFKQVIGLVQSEQDMKVVSVQGIKPEIESKSSIIAKNMIHGDFSTLVPRRYNLILGQQLAYKLNLGLGDTVRVMLSEGSVYTPMGRKPSQRNFTVSGVFDVGSDVDANAVLIHLDDLNRMLRLKPTNDTFYRIYLNDAFNVSEFLTQIETHSDKVNVISHWKQQQGGLFEAVKMEKNMMWLMLALIIAVATFNIISALVMVVNDKQGEIASLKTMGLSASNLVIIFIFQGMYKGCIGALLGTLLGVVIALNLNDALALLGVGIFAVPAYSGEGLPVELVPIQITMIVLSAIFMSFLATLYPAVKAAKTHPAEILRYE